MESNQSEAPSEQTEPAVAALTTQLEEAKVSSVIAPFQIGNFKM